VTGLIALKASRCFDGERFTPDGVTVLLESGRIVGVEPLAYDVPDGIAVTTYDGTLLPGLVDAHVHLVAEATRPGAPGSLEAVGGLDDDAIDAAVTRSLASQGVAGVTTVRDLGDRGYRTLVARDRHAPGEPRVVAAGPPLTVPAGHCHYLGGVASGVGGVRDAVREHADRGVDVIKVMASGGLLTLGSDLFGVQFTAEELRAAVDEAHAAGLRILAHCQSEAGARHAVAAGVDGLEHATLLSPEGIAVPEDLIADIGRLGIVVDPTLGIDAEHVLPIEQMPAHVQEMARRLGLVPADFAVRRAGQLARMLEHGVRLVSGLDAGVTPPKPHGGLWRAVVQLLDAGMTAAQALASATSVAADECGLAEETGRLLPGRAADLLLVDGDLSTDLTALSRPVQVWVRGTALGQRP
jgi:imidazolonepropionase-like amidohydrolase